MQLSMANRNMILPLRVNINDMNQRETLVGDKPLKTSLSTTQNVHNVLTKFKCKECGEMFWSEDVNKDDTCLSCKHM